MDTQDSSRPGLGGSHHLPPYSILCTSSLPPPLQSVWPQPNRIPYTLPARLPYGPACLDCLQKNLERVVSSRRRHISWPFVLLGEAVEEREEDPPDLLAYHKGGFSYLRQPLDILRSLILYYLWSERCRKHFDDRYSLKQVLTQAWVATVEVGMATWKAIRAHRTNKEPVI